MHVIADAKQTFVHTVGGCSLISVAAYNNTILWSIFTVSLWKSDEGVGFSLGEPVTLENFKHSTQLFKVCAFFG